MSIRRGRSACGRPAAPSGPADHRFVLGEGGIEHQGHAGQLRETCDQAIVERIRGPRNSLQTARAVHMGPGRPIGPQPRPSRSSNWPSIWGIRLNIKGWDSCTKLEFRPSAEYILAGSLDGALTWECADGLRYNADGPNFGNVLLAIPQWMNISGPIGVKGVLHS